MRGQLQKLLLLSLIWIRLQASYGRPGHLSSDGRQLLQRLDLRQIQKGPPVGVGSCRCCACTQYLPCYRLHVSLHTCCSWHPSNGSAQRR
jgi:hypothetical protein